MTTISVTMYDAVLAERNQLRVENESLRYTARVDDERLRVHGERVGLYFGCDTAEHMADEILALRAALAAAPRWVSVTERLPEALPVMGWIALLNTGVWVQALYSDSWIEYDNKEDCWIPLHGVTHWLELPPAPEAER